MLTVNADQHRVMNQFHRPDDEKRMLVIVPTARYSEWLSATPETAANMMLQLPAEQLVAQAAPRPAAPGKSGKASKTIQAAPDLWSPPQD